MAGPHLATSSLGGVRLLGDQGQRSHDLITATLAEALGERHAALFAEPVFAASGDLADWYATVPGRSRRLVDLPEDEAEEVRRDLGQLAADISRLAESLAASTDSADQRIGEALANALEVPHDEAIHVLEGPDGARQPVLTDWARLADKAEPVRGRLTSLAPKPDPVAPPPPPPLTTSQQPEAGPTLAAMPAAGPVGRDPYRLVRWLWLLGWLLLALLLAAIMWLLVAPCGLRGPAFLDFCPATAQAATSDDVEGEALRQRIARLERDLGTADRDCQPDRSAALDEAQVPADDGPVDEQEDEIDRRLDRENAERGDLEFALSWDTRADLDLFVTCPGGETISYRNRQGRSCGGALDVDANNNLANATLEPVEHIVFSNPPEGRYGIEVVFYRGSQVAGTHEFAVRIRFGETTETFEGSVDARRRAWSTRYDYEE